MARYKAIVKHQRVVRANKIYTYPIIKPVNFDPRLLKGVTNIQIDIKIPKPKKV